MPNPPSIIPPHGGYRKLRSFQTARQVYDAIVVFCDRFIDKRSRTHDQMVQAARSGVQNIAEGSKAAATSKKMEIKLTSVARASLEELMLDYEGFLRHRGLPLWDKNSPEALAVRKRLAQGAAAPSAVPLAPSDRADLPDRSDKPVSKEAGPPDPLGIKTASPEEAANTLICLINQASYLLGRQLAKLEQDFLTQGGFTERLYQARKSHRNG